MCIRDSIYVYMYVYNPPEYISIYNIFMYTYMYIHCVYLYICVCIYIHMLTIVYTWVSSNVREFFSSGIQDMATRMFRNRYQQARCQRRQAPTVVVVARVYTGVCGRCPVSIDLSPEGQEGTYILIRPKLAYRPPTSELIACLLYTSPSPRD